MKAMHFRNRVSVSTLLALALVFPFLIQAADINVETATVTDTTGASLDQRPNLVLSDACKTPANPGNYNNWIKTECFTFPAQNTLGNLGRNTMRKAPISNLDFSLSKKFKITEDVNTQLRMELFNALNHTNFGTPNFVMFDNQGRIPAAFGRVTSTSTESRRVQLALKVTF